MVIRILLRLTAVVAVCIVAAVPLSVRADPYSDGKAAYKSGDYTTAATDFGRAASGESGTKQALALYEQGLSYHHLGKDDLAVKSYQAALGADPSFSQTHANFEKNLQRAEHRQSSSGQSTALASTGDDPAKALVSSNVYISPGQTRYADSNTLEEAAQYDAHTLVKIAVIDRVPSGYSNLHSYAQQIHDYLNLGNQGLIVVAATGPHRGVAVVSRILGESEEKSLAQAVVARIGSGDVDGGVTSLAHSLSSAIDGKERMGPDILFWVFFVVVVVVAILIISAIRRKKAQLVAMRGPLEALRQNILANIEYIDNYADVLPKNNADSDQVRAFRQAAEAKYEQAAKIMSRATETSDMNRAQGILDRAGSDLKQARRFLDRATGGTANIAGDSAMRPAPLPETQTQVEAVPQTQRGVSFFSSQPAPLSSLVPVTLNIDGQQRQVMATPEEARAIAAGQIPSVRSFNVGGQSVPWYAYQGYDPYRDYWSYRNNNWSGLDGVAAGFIGAELLDSIFQPRGYGWYSPYGYAPGFDSWGGWNNYDGGYDRGYDQGYVSGEHAEAAQNMAFNDPSANYNSDPGSASFVGSGYDTTGYGSGSGGNTGTDNS